MLRLYLLRLRTPPSCVPPAPSVSWRWPQGSVVGGLGDRAHLGFPWGWPSFGLKEKVHFWSWHVAILLKYS